LATGVSLTRVLGPQHFPSDVLVGGVAGWLIGPYVFQKHHVYHAPRALRAKHAHGDWQ
jgi:membrane-associated phospholipid phosphatase